MISRLKSSGGERQRVLILAARAADRTTSAAYKNQLSDVSITVGAH